MAWVAILCPLGMAAAAVTPASGIGVPARISARAITTLSFGLRRMVSADMDSLRRLASAGDAHGFGQAERQVIKYPARQRNRKRRPAASSRLCRVMSSVLFGLI